MLRILPLLLLLPAAAAAQVSVNSGALDQLTPSAPAAQAEHRTPPHRAVRRRPVRPAHPAAPAHASVPAATHAAPARPPVAPQPPVQVAPAAPPAAVLTPPTISTQPHPPPPPLTAIVPDAAGVASEIPGGVRVTFGNGKADLNAATDGALHAFAKSIADDPAKSVNLYAYAAGTPDDPSTPRRLSLSRALAARAILINEGIASTRIYPRALGATSSGGPPDRVDVTVVGAAPPPVSSAAPATAP